MSQYGLPSLSKKPVVLSSILHATHTKCSGCHTSPSAVIIYQIEKKLTTKTTFQLFCPRFSYINFDVCPFVYVTHCTFPTMHLLQEAQWPLAVVRTPIFSKSELRPPSRSSIVSVFLLVLEAFASGPDVPPLLLLLSFCSPSVLFFTDCFCVSGGGVAERA